MLHRRQVLSLAMFGLLSMASWLPQTAYAAEATLMQAEITLDEPGQKPGLFLSVSYEFDLPHPLLKLSTVVLLCTLPTSLYSPKIAGIGLIER